VALAKIDSGAIFGLLSVHHPHMSMNDAFDAIKHILNGKSPEWIERERGVAPDATKALTALLQEARPSQPAPTITQTLRGDDTTGATDETAHPVAVLAAEGAGSSDGRPGRLTQYTANTLGAAGSPMTLGEARILFDQIIGNDFFETTEAGALFHSAPYDYSEAGGEVRAHLIALQLITAGVPCKKIFAVKPDPFADPLEIHTYTGAESSPESPATVVWERYHVGVVIDAVDDHGRPLELVIDPSIADRPVTTAQWLDAMHVLPEQTRRIGETYQQGVAALKELVAYRYTHRWTEPDARAVTTLVFTAEPEAYEPPETHRQYFGGAWYLDFVAGRDLGEGGSTRRLLPRRG
jgi:hypothetical protein